MISARRRSALPSAERSCHTCRSAPPPSLLQSTRAANASDTSRSARTASFAPASLSLSPSFLPTNEPALQVRPASHPCATTETYRRATPSPVPIPSAATTLHALSHPQRGSRVPAHLKALLDRQQRRVLPLPGRSR